MSLPIPKYTIGDKVWVGRTVQDCEEHPCPDCKGKGTWYWESPAGDTGDVECPRCYGSKVLKMQAYEMLVEELTIGSVRIDTAETYGDVVKYMCRETGVGNGSVYGESTLFASRREATEAAKTKTNLANIKIDEKLPDRVTMRHIYASTIKDARVEKAEAKERKVGRRLSRLLERICELHEYPVAGGRYEEKDLALARHTTLTSDQIEVVQESLVWLDDESADYLDQHREAADECNC